MYWNPASVVMVLVSVTFTKLLDNCLIFPSHNTNTLQLAQHFLESWELDCSKEAYRSNPTLIIQVLCPKYAMSSAIGARSVIGYTSVATKSCLIGFKFFSFFSWLFIYFTFQLLLHLPLLPVLSVPLPLPYLPLIFPSSTSPQKRKSLSWISTRLGI